MEVKLKINSSEFIILSVCNQPMSIRDVSSKLPARIKISNSVPYISQIVKSLRNKGLLIYSEGKITRTRRGDEFLVERT